MYKRKMFVKVRYIDQKEEDKTGTLEKSNTFFSSSVRTKTTKKVEILHEQKED